MWMYEVPYGRTVELLETSEGPPGSEVTFIDSVVKQNDPTYDAAMYVKVSFQGKTRYIKAWTEVREV